MSYSFRFDRFRAVDFYTHDKFYFLGCNLFIVSALLSPGAIFHCRFSRCSTTGLGVSMKPAQCMFMCSCVRHFQNPLREQLPSCRHHTFYVRFLHPLLWILVINHESTKVVAYQVFSLYSTPSKHIFFLVVFPVSPTSSGSNRSYIM